MNLIEEGIDVLKRPWKGSCHSCKAVFETTGAEVAEKNPGDQHAEITVFDCKACGAKRKVYFRPEYVSPQHQDKPQPPPVDKDRIERVHSERTAALNGLSHVPDPGIPGFITYTEIGLFDYLELDDEGVFFRTEHVTKAVSEITEIATAVVPYGVSFGIVRTERWSAVTVEPYEELVRRLKQAQAHLKP